MQRDILVPAGWGILRPPKLPSHETDRKHLVEGHIALQVHQILMLAKTT